MRKIAAFCMLFCLGLMALCVGQTIAQEEEGPRPSLAGKFSGPSEFNDALVKSFRVRAYEISDTASRHVPLKCSATLDSQGNFEVHGLQKPARLFF